MRKRKTIALTLLLLFLLSSVCMAYQPDPARWGWIYSDSDVGIFYDKKTIQHYTGSTDRCDMWTLWVIPADKVHLLVHTIIYKNKTHKAKEIIKYADSGEVMEHDDLSYIPADSIVPGSVMEAVYDHFYR